MKPEKSPVWVDDRSLLIAQAEPLSRTWLLSFSHNTFRTTGNPAGSASKTCGHPSQSGLLSRLLITSLAASALVLPPPQTLLPPSNLLKP